ncbi:MAG: peptidyl-prolyl cis-trans isomerase [Planctomycetes bacterium]|nr:peptidyl-prolyl cis-trans isomerase [Planctomycetota bacterium]
MIGVRLVLATLPLCLAAPLTAFPQQDPTAPSTQDDGLEALKKRVAALESAVLEIRRQVGVQTMVEHVADDLHQRKPRFESFRLEKGAQIAKPIAPGPQPVAGDQFPQKTAPVADVPDPDAAPVLRVGALTLTRGEVEGEIRFAQAFVPGSTDSVVRHVLGKSVLPRAIAMTLMADQKDAVTAQAERARAALMAGKSLDEIASAEEGVETATIGPFERSGQKIAIAKAAFETEVNGTSNVFFDELGAHVVKVTKKERTSKDAGAALVATAEHVFVPFRLDGKADATALAQRIEDQRNNVEILLLDPRYQKAFPSGYAMKTQYKAHDALKPGTDADQDAAQKR